MKSTTINLLAKVNTKLKSRPLVYFSRDCERSLGLEHMLENYYHCCIEEGYIYERLQVLHPNHAFALATQVDDLQIKSTSILLGHPETLDWLKTITKGEQFYAQLFHYSQSALFKLENLGAQVLNNSAALNRRFEPKLAQYSAFKDLDIPFPKTIIAEIQSLDYSAITQELGPKFVVQSDRAHTGSGTTFITNSQDFTTLQQRLAGNSVRISHFVEGDPYTINGCITKNGVFVAGLQYQITGNQDLTPGAGSTVGNDFSYPWTQLTSENIANIHSYVQKIGAIMATSGYRGLFGVDLILGSEGLYIIEINARQTANLPLQTYLELEQDQTPLALINLCEFLEIEHELQPFEELTPLQGSQIFLRSLSDNYQIQGEVRSGIYRLQSDNSAQEWSVDETGIIFGGEKQNVIYLDEEKDMPLIWQAEGYNVTEIQNGGFILLVQGHLSKKNKFDELARLQFKNGIINNHQITPWIMQALRALRETL